MAAILGELTNNAFNHNLGQWRDHQGCMVGFEVDTKLKVLRIAIADRGQGIISSLQNTVAPIKDPKVILEKAFYERVSGRAPEKRGNGLKFVLKHIQEKSNYLLCVTQKQKLEVGHPKLKLDIKNTALDFSTLIYIEWSLR